MIDNNKIVTFSWDAIHDIFMLFQNYSRNRNINVAENLEMNISLEDTPQIS